MRLNVGIDGPVGAGKSTVADAVAAKLGILHLDTGVPPPTSHHCISPCDSLNVSPSLMKKILHWTNLVGDLF